MASPWDRYIKKPAQIIDPRFNVWLRSGPWARYVKAPEPVEKPATTTPAVTLSDGSPVGLMGEPAPEMAPDALGEVQAAPDDSMAQSAPVMGQQGPVVGQDLGPMALSTPVTGQEPMTTTNLGPVGTDAPVAGVAPEAAPMSPADFGAVDGGGLMSGADDGVGVDVSGVDVGGAAGAGVSAGDPTAGADAGASTGGADASADGADASVGDTGTGDVGGGGDGSDGGSCFITSATLDATGTDDDNAPELMALREFRDGYMRKDPALAKLVQEYEALAPQVVRGISARPDAKQVYQKLHANYIQPAVKAIQANNPRGALDIYAGMIKFASPLAQQAAKTAPQAQAVQALGKDAGLIESGIK